VKDADKDKPCTYIEQFFYGSVTVGERGQVVIPAKARRDYNIECGDQLLIMGHPTKNGLMVAKVDAIRTFLTQMIDDLKFIESQQAAVTTASSALTDGVEPIVQEGS
jgi:AbrB family looped-hinge helix DNA binding protein